MTVRALPSARGQGIADGSIDEPWQSARALEQCLDGAGFEQGEFAAGQTQAVGEVVVELVAVESVGGGGARRGVGRAIRARPWRGGGATR